MTGQRFVKFEVQGKPRAWKRAAPGRGRGKKSKTRIYSTLKEEVKLYRIAVKKSCTNVTKDLKQMLAVSKTCSVKIDFCLPRPKSHYLAVGPTVRVKQGKPKTWPLVKTPDLDNMVKFVLDSIQGGVVIKDDFCVTNIFARKLYVNDGSEGKTIVTVENVSE